MTQMTDQREVSAPSDLVTAIQQVLRSSPEPLTVSKIRGSLPAPFRQAPVEELVEVLRRQVAANVLESYPRYRSQQERFWDRPMPVHVADLLRAALEETPLSWSELRRRLPAYAQEKAQTVLEEQIAQRSIHRHPRFGRLGERFGLLPADPKEYLRSELAAVFQSLVRLGFSEANLREGALELLHDEEWAPSRLAPQSGDFAGPPTEAPPSYGQRQDVSPEASVAPDHWADQNEAW